MDLFFIILTIIGLCVFEIISSIDNAVINAQVLSTMKERYRKWFLFWGLIIAVFAIRGLLPWLIVWASVPTLGPVEAFTAAFSSDPIVAESIEHAAPLLLMAGGIFLIFLFLHWLFLEEKHFGLPTERFFMRNGVWFFAIVSILLAVIVWLAIQKSPLLGFAAVVGSTAFFITHGFKQNAEQAEKQLLHGNLSDISKVLYLEVIDATFSIDGVVGAFAFTLSVPLIILGNGLGALVIRQFTVGNIERIKRYAYLKNGAMYSILILGTIMVFDGFGAEIPQWLSPISTMTILAFFYLKSRKHPEYKKAKRLEQKKKKLEIRSLNNN
jgi:hypothetical protein